MRRRQPPCMRAAIWGVGKYRSRAQSKLQGGREDLFLPPFHRKGKRKRMIRYGPLPFAFLQKNRRMSR